MYANNLTIYKTVNKVQQYFHNNLEKNSSRLYLHTPNNRHLLLKTKVYLAKINANPMLLLHSNMTHYMNDRSRQTYETTK